MGQATSLELKGKNAKILLALDESHFKREKWKRDSNGSVSLEKNEERLPFSYQQAEKLSQKSLFHLIYGKNGTKGYLSKETWLCIKWGGGKL